MLVGPLLYLVAFLTCIFCYLHILLLFEIFLQKLDTILVLNHLAK